MSHVIVIGTAAFVPTSYMAVARQVSVVQCTDLTSGLDSAATSYLMKRAFALLVYNKYNYVQGDLHMLFIAIEYTTAVVYNL